MLNNAVEIKNLTKQYKIFFEKPSIIKTFIPSVLGKGVYETIYALNGISMEIKKSESAALIGNNGSGKSTLLRVIAGLTKPSSGKIKVKGRLSTLLEVASGFHPELTGRENIFLNSALFGFKFNEIKKMFALIVDFSGLDKFIDSKLMTYSSGMLMRLAFSVAIHSDFDLLLIDEVIAVGDIEFQKKCREKLKEINTTEKTFIIVSHQMGILKEVCARAFWLEDGKIKKEGKALEVINAYEKEV